MNKKMLMVLVAGLVLFPVTSTTNFSSLFTDEIFNFLQSKGFFI